MILTGDVLDVARTLPDDSVDAVLCDPPYGYSFMGKQWDRGVPSAMVWREILRVSKPGAHLMAFGGTRTFHRLACAIEDAGWEIRDCLQWVYGQGFPKNADVSKAIDREAGHWRGRAGDVMSINAAMGGPNYARTPKGDPVTAAAREWSGYGTALKPSWEPIVLARRPLDGTVAANVQRWGVGALAIDACRISHMSEEDRARLARIQQPNTRTKRPGVHDGAATERIDAFFDPNVGRWPANTVLDEEAAAMLDEQTGTIKTHGGGGANPGGGGFQNGGHSVGYRPIPKGDSGGASRFFYVAKVAPMERNAGCDELPVMPGAEIHNRDEGSPGLANPRAGAASNGAQNHHPTLKPIALTTWLARLLRPPRPGTLLVPFSGTGSEMIGALGAGWPDVVGIELSPEYVEIARARIAALGARAEQILRAPAPPRRDERQLTLFARTG